MLALREVIFSITNRCNLHCKMCDIPTQVSPLLSSDRWKTIIRDVSLAGAKTIVFSGGEPLLRDDLCDLISFTKNNHMNACLTSNGLLIDKANAVDLARCKVDVVNISVEGSEQTHDYLRGEGSFCKAISALDNLRGHKIESTIATMVSRYNYKELPYLVELARQMGVTTIRFQPFSRIFINNSSKEKHFFIEQETIPKFFAIINKTYELCQRYKIATNPINYLNQIPTYLSGRKMVPRQTCLALWTSCPINARGDILPCWNIADKVIGNLSEKSFLELWNSKQHGRIREEIRKMNCPGCMMSCYDQIYGADKAVLLRQKAKKLKTKIFYKKLFNYSLQYLRQESFRLKSKYNFYRSYRGSAKQICKRAVNKLMRNVGGRTTNEKSDFVSKKEEISRLKLKIKKQMEIIINENRFIHSMF